MHMSFCLYTCYKGMFSLPLDKNDKLEKKRDQSSLTVTISTFIFTQIRFV